MTGHSSSDIDMRTDKLVCFAHGKEAGPWGTKIARLAHLARVRGFGVMSPDYRDLSNPDDRVQRLLDLRPEAERLVLVGSSMGGYVSTVASRTLLPSGLFLMAPAFYMDGYAEAAPVPFAAHTVVIHGWQDEVIPAEHAVRFAAEHEVDLHVLAGGDHQLHGVMPRIEALFALFLDALSY